MRYLTVFTLLVLLTACQGSPVRSTDSEVRATARMARPDAGVATWLNLRQELCALTPEERRQRLAVLGTDVDRQPNRYRLERVLLASCQPDLTPGILLQSLSALQPEKSWTPAQHALVALLWDAARSYQVLENKNTELRNELAKTIDGIRKIETDMEDLEINGDSP